MGGLVCGEGAVLVVSECAVLSSFEKKSEACTVRLSRLILFNICTLWMA